MPILKKCCGCVKLRTGSKILAWLTLFGAIYSIFLAYNMISKISRGEFESIESKAWRFCLMIVSVAVVVVKWIMCFILFWGVYAKRPHHLKKYSIYIAIFLVLFNVFAIHTVNQECKEKKDILWDLIIWVLYDVFEIYCFLCILSYYQELKEQEDTKNPKIALPLYARAPQIPVVDPANNPGPAQDQRHV